MKITALFALAALAALTSAQPVATNKKLMKKIVGHNIQTLATKMHRQNRKFRNWWYSYHPAVRGGFINACGPPGMNCPINKRSVDEPIDETTESPVQVDGDDAYVPDYAGETDFDEDEGELSPVVFVS